MNKRLLDSGGRGNWGDWGGGAGRVRLSKISWFVSGEQINYLPRHWQTITDNRVLQLFYHSISDYFLMNIFGKRSDVAFSRKKVKSVVSFTHKKNIISNWRTLRMSRPLFVGSYLQVTWWALDQWKGTLKYLLQYK